MLLLLREDLAFSPPTLDLSALLMLPLSPDSLASRAAIGLFDSLGVALPGGFLPLPLSFRGSTTRAFSGLSRLSWYQIVAYYPGDLVPGYQVRPLREPERPGAGAATDNMGSAAR